MVSADPMPPKLTAIRGMREAVVGRLRAARQPDHHRAARSRYRATRTCTKVTEVQAVLVLATVSA